MSFCDLDACRLAITLFQRQASVDLNGAHQDAPRQALHIDSVFSGTVPFNPDFQDS